jgi:hypothetical protein
MDGAVDNRFVTRSVDGAEASRRAAWAKYYEELEQNRSLVQLNEILRDRVTVLLELLHQMTEAVLTKKKIDAFAMAYHVQEMIDEFLCHTNVRS